METSEPRPMARSRLQGEQKTGRLMKCLISSEPVSQERLGRSNVNRFTDGEGRAEKAVLATVLHKQEFRVPMIKYFFKQASNDSSKKLFMHSQYA